jgi:hypothetical protein
VTLIPIETSPDELMRYFLLVFGFAFCAILLVFLYFAVSIVRSSRRTRRNHALGMSVDQLDAGGAHQQTSPAPDAKPAPGDPDT